MEPGPLPPHERTWRHPSELGPTKADIEPEARIHGSVLAVGALAIIAVAAMVVVLTPRVGSGPVAISVTTTPIGPNVVVVAPPGADSDASQSATVRTSNRPAAVRSSPAVLLTSFSSYPHAITSAPQPDLDRTDVAQRAPGAHDMVFVRTEDVTYRLEWALVPMIDVADGSVVFDESGNIVARISNGELITLVGE